MGMVETKWWAKNRHVGSGKFKKKHCRRLFQANFYTGRIFLVVDKKMYGINRKIELKPIKDF